MRQSVHSRVRQGRLSPMLDITDWESTDPDDAPVLGDEHFRALTSAWEEGRWAFQQRVQFSSQMSCVHEKTPGRRPPSVEVFALPWLVIWSCHLGPLLQRRIPAETASAQARGASLIRVLRHASVYLRWLLVHARLGSRCRASGQRSFGRCVGAMVGMAKVSCRDWRVNNGDCGQLVIRDDFCPVTIVSGGVQC